MDVARGVSRRRQLHGSLLFPQCFSNPHSPSFLLHNLAFSALFPPFSPLSVPLFHALTFPVPRFSSVLFISLRSYPALGYTPRPPPTIFFFSPLLLLNSLSLLDAPSAPLCSWVPLCSANASCLVFFLAVQQMFLRCCGDRRTKGSFHFGCGMERDCAAALRGRRSGGSHAYIQHLASLSTDLPRPWR